MKRLRWSFSILTTGIFACLLIVPLGCDIESGDEVVRNVDINVTGVYRDNNGVPERQSGDQITTISITQSGDQLDGIDSRGVRWKGNINNVSGDTASITLRGQTTTGLEVVITGSIRISGETGTLTGTWVEPALTADVSATAAVAAIPTATPTPNATTSATATPFATSSGGFPILPGT